MSPNDRHVSLSVVLPTYNHAAFLGEAVDALLRQTRRPDQLIVIDDASTDATPRLLDALASRDPALEVVRNETNRGTVFSMNRGLALARGRYLYTASSDDRADPRLFERTLELLAAHPKAPLCITDFAFLEAETGATHPKHLGLSRDSCYLTAEDVIRRLYLPGYILPAYGGIFDCDALRAIGGFRSELRWHSDWFATLVLAFRGGCCYVPEPLAAIRHLGGSYSSGSRDFQRQREVLIALLDLLEGDEFHDVAPAFLQSRALAYFGAGILRTMAASPRHRHLLSWLPLGRILWREVKNMLIRSFPHGLRRIFWDARHRLRAPRTGAPRG